MKHIPKLGHPPLKEVIFEAHWDLEADKKGVLDDPGFEFGKGLFRAELAHKFPFVKEIPIPILPLRVIDTPFYQFWAGVNNQFPVIQLGKGVITVNHSDGYVWEDNFFPNIEFALNSLTKSYSERSPFTFNRLILKYIDAVEIKDNDNIIDFIADNLNVKVSNNFELKAPHRSVRIDQKFLLDGGTELFLVIEEGKNTKNLAPAIIWHTGVQKQCNFTTHEALEWAIAGHEIISNLFRTMLNKDFYDSFR